MPIQIGLLAEASVALRASEEPERRTKTFVTGPVLSPSFQERYDAAGEAQQSHKKKPVLFYSPKGPLFVVDVANMPLQIGGDAEAAIAVGALIRLLSRMSSQVPRQICGARKNLPFPPCKSPKFV